MCKLFGSGKPQQSAAAMCGPSLAERPERQAAVDRSRLLTPYKQEVARSSRAPPITRKPGLGAGLAKEVVNGVDHFATV